MNGDFDVEPIVPSAIADGLPTLGSEGHSSIKNIARHSREGAPAVDREASLQRLAALAVGIGKPDSRVPPNVLLGVPPDQHDRFAVIMSASLAYLAQVKNIYLADNTFIAALAYAAMERLDAPTLAGMMRDDPAAFRQAGLHIDRLLDEVAAVQFLFSLWRLEGYDEQLDANQFTALAEAWLSGRVANDVPDSRLRWPNTFDMISAYYRSRSKAGVSVQLPTGRAVNVTLFLDRRAVRKPQALPADARVPKFLVPLVFHCPGLPDKFIPDGKQTLRRDGLTVTGWWRGGKLHRDPKDGPAFIRTENRREYCQYRLDGELHRDHREGPAVIDTNADGEGGHAEEYWRHGKRHRPAEEGPAAYDTDRHGKPLREIYFEDGACHRDSSQGPAWSGLEDGKHIEAYLTRGKHHRPEEEGPAVTVRDPASGRLIKQEYFSGGKSHRVGGPAFVTYAEDGAPLIEIWEQDGVMHRDPAEGPAAIWRGDIETRVQFFVEGRCHRDPAEGPASIVRTPAGELVEVGYWINGEQVRRYRSKRRRRAARRKTRRHARASRREAKESGRSAGFGIVAANATGAAT